MDSPRQLRQNEYEEGERFTSADGVGMMKKSFVQALPFNADATEWADANHFDQRRVAALKYRYDARRHRYEWVETGPFMTPPTGAAQPVLTEASLAPVSGGWSLAARTEGGTGAAWVRSEDPFT